MTDFKIKNGGLKEKIVEGHQFAKQVENNWPAQMKKRRHYFIRSSLVRNI
jgi:hypothetical protein